MDGEGRDEVIYACLTSRFSIVGRLHDQELACSASDHQGSNFEHCVRGAVSPHHPQEVILTQFSKYLKVHIRMY